jgi:hypothetical protein
MKTKNQLKVWSLAVLVALSFALTSCGDDDNGTGPIDVSEFEILTGDISQNITLDANKKYLLRGKVHIQRGFKITIPAGTKIFGEKSTDGTLIINRGAQIDAQGTAANPIIMTSQAPRGFRNRGDWGGLVILGDGYTNGSANSVIEGLTAAAGSDNGLYGPGSNAPVQDQNSGILTYVRVEFAGIDLSLDNELNSITMGAVGSGTVMDHLMVSYANDDAYEWFGGSNNHKYLIAYSTLDDDFDSDRGWNGKVQYGVIVREASQADISGSRAFECSSNNAAPQNHGGVERHSAPIFSNITVLGPRMFRPAAQIDGFYQAVVEINSSSNIKIYNSILTGFPTGVRYNSSGPDALLSGNLFANNGTLSSVSGGSVLPENFATVNTDVADVTTLFGAYTGSVANTYSFTNLPFFQAADSPGLSGAVTVGDNFFETTSYRGAFGTSASAGWNWNSGWVEFDPINAEY